MAKTNSHTRKAKRTTKITEVYLFKKSKNKMRCLPHLRK